MLSHAKNDAADLIPTNTAVSQGDNDTVLKNVDVYM